MKSVESLRCQELLVFPEVELIVSLVKTVNTPKKNRFLSCLDMRLVSLSVSS